MTLSESIEIFRENLIKVTIYLIKHTPFINSGENGKDTNGAITFDIKIPLLFMNGYIMSAFFNYEGKIEVNSELLKL